MVAENKNVLIVDDEDVVQKSYRRVLAEAGYRVHGAKCADDALDVLRQQPCDLVLTDLKLPGRDGLSVIEELRRTQPHLPVVVITGYPSETTAKEAQRLGVCDYLAKPVTPAALLRTTTQALEAALRPALALQPIAVGESLAPPVPWHLPLGVPTTVPRRRASSASRGAGLGWLRDLAALAAAPFLGLAYVLFLPFLGFAMVLGLAGQALWSAVRPRREVAVEAED